MFWDQMDLSGKLIRLDRILLSSQSKSVLYNKRLNAWELELFSDN